MIIHPRTRRIGDMLMGTTVVRVGYSRPLAFVGIVILLLISGSFLDAQKESLLKVNVIESTKNAIQLQEDIESKVGKIEKIEEANKDAFKINRDDKNLNIDLNITGESGQMQVRVGFVKDENGDWILKQVDMKDHK